MEQKITVHKYQSCKSSKSCYPVFLVETSSLAKRKPQRRSGPPSANGLSVRRSTDGRSWVLVHPRCARDRSEDLEEAQLMVDAGEFELATDELRWLLADCAEFIAAHALLGELALATNNDVALARGHFGAGYQLGLQTLRRAKMPTPLLYSQPANRSFFDAGRGLAWCLATLEKPDMAQEVVDTLLNFDKSDPLKLRAMLDEFRSGGLPVVDLLSNFPDRKADESGDT